MPVPTSITDLSTTASSNYPGGTDSVAANTGPDDYFRAHAAIIRTLAAADTIAAASTVDLSTKNNTFITLTGTATTINALGTVAAGVAKWLIYNAAHTVTHNATSLILIGGATRTVAAGDASMFVSEGSGNWRELFYSGGAYQPLDADLTAIAALTTTAFGRGMLEYADAATAFTALKQAATETATGVVELATTAEAAAATDTAKVVTPAGLAASEFGRGQTWQDMTASRALDGAGYTNSTGKPIEIKVTVIVPGSGGAVKLTVGGVLVDQFSNNMTGTNAICSLSATVPNGALYIAETVALTPVLATWSELTA